MPKTPTTTVPAADLTVRHYFKLAGLTYRVTNVNPFFDTIKIEAAAQPQSSGRVIKLDVDKVTPFNIFIPE